MSHTITITVSDRTYRAIKQEAINTGVSIEQAASAILERATSGLFNERIHEQRQAMGAIAADTA